MVEIYKPSTHEKYVLNNFTLQIFLEKAELLFVGGF